MTLIWQTSRWSVEGGGAGGGIRHVPMPPAPGRNQEEKEVAQRWDLERRSDRAACEAIGEDSLFVTWGADGKPVIYGPRDNSKTRPIGSCRSPGGRP